MYEISFNLILQGLTPIPRTFFQSSIVIASAHCHWHNRVRLITQDLLDIPRLMTTPRRTVMSVLSFLCSGPMKGGNFWNMTGSSISGSLSESIVRMDSWIFLTMTLL